METKILDIFPVAPPYRYIDEIAEVSPAGIRASYTFREDEFFYRGHFPGWPVTPGAILAETMAQVGLLAYGIYLLGEQAGLEGLRFLLTSSELKYRGTVLPGEKVEVTAQPLYYRFRKLKCQAKMVVEGKGVVCRGTLSGMIILPSDE